MKETGIVRRIDDLGRIVIPKELRRTLRIREGESLEIFVENNNIVLKKHSAMDNMEEFSRKYVESIYATVKQNILITDRDNIIAAAGPIKKKYVDKPISEYLENSINRRDNFIERHKREVEFSPGLKEETTYSMSPIIINGDSVGLVIIFSDDKDLSGIEEKTTQIAAQFIGKHIEN